MVEANVIEAIGSEEDAAKKLGALWRRPDDPPTTIYPLALHAAARCLWLNGYNITPELLQNWCNRGMIPADFVVNQGATLLTARGLLTAFQHCETWRRFRLVDRHLHKLTGAEVEAMRAEAAGEALFTDLEEFDVWAFVEMIDRANNPQLRHMFCLALKTRLKQLGVLDE